jgi:hypothetical protein
MIPAKMGGFFYSNLAMSLGAKMDQKLYEEIVNNLHAMTPSLVQETLLIFQADPDLVRRFDYKLPELAEQEVLRLCEILLGAVLMDYPTALGRQFQWLVQAASVREYNLQTVRRHLRLWHTRLSVDLPPEQATIVVRIFDQAVKQMEESIRHLKEKKAG